MNKYIYPKRIQEVLNELNDAELRFFEMYPNLRYYMRDALVEEFEAQEYRKLMEPEKVFVACRGCAKFVFVLRSPENRQRLHFFAGDRIEYTGQLEGLYKGLSLLVKAEDEEAFNNVAALMLKTDPNEYAYPQPFVYRTVRV